MRIAFVAFHGSVHTRRWVAFFAARGHDVHVVTCGGVLPGEEVPYAVHDLGVPPLGRIGYLVRVPRARRLLRRLDPDVVHVHWLTSYGLLGLASGVRPLVSTAHGDDVLIAPRRRPMRALVRRVLRASSLVTVPSEEMRAAVVDLVGGRVPVEVFQYGVETSRLAALGDEVRKSAPPGGGGVRLVSARPLLPLYRVDVLLDAVSVLRGRGRDVRCAVYGDGPQRGRLEERAARLGISASVEFLGRQAEPETERGIAAADVYVSLAQSDGASLALLEALALGTVAVLSDIPANRAWIAHGTNGVLTQVGAEAVADAIEAALALDPQAARLAGRETVAARADRATNLGRFEGRLRELVGASDAVEAAEATG